MLGRIRTQFNLLPRAKRLLVAMVRHEVARGGKKWLVCSKGTRLPESLAGIGAIELREWDLYEDGISDKRFFLRDFCEKIIELYGPFDRKLEQELKGELSFAVGELIKNAALHGNRGKTNKKILISFDHVENGFFIDVFDEGRGSLFLFRSSYNFRDLAAWFRIGYGGQNCGITAIQRYFGQENLTATKIYNQFGKRVGTCVRLFVQTLSS